MITLRDWARSLKRQTLTLYYATRDPRTPWYAKAVAALIVGYAISPIDLIPEPVLAEARARAELSAERPTSRTLLSSSYCCGSEPQRSLVCGPTRH